MIDLNAEVLKMFLLFLFMFATLLNAENDYNELEPIVVTVTRTPVEMHSFSRNVIVISQDDIKKNGFENFEQILNFAAGIDIQAREQEIQSDISIRGASFEQAIVMIDGVPLNNPQTGHHNMNIPINMSDIEQVEIMPGQSSSLYGSGGFGGTINIITKTSAKRNINLSFEYGSFNRYKFTSGGATKLGNLNMFYSYIKTKSDSFQYGTEYDVTSLNTKLFYSIDEKRKGCITLYYGYSGKDFGAYDFYTPGKDFPSKEKSYNHIGYLSFNKKWSGLYFEAKTYYNRASDDFILTRENPELYHNIHYTDKYGIDIMSSFELTKNVFLTALVNRNIDKIDSSNLGKHYRKSVGIVNEFLFSDKLWGINLSSRVDLYDNSQNYYSPTIGIYYWIAENLKFRSSVGISYRIPSFTELYYYDGVSIGDDQLEGEKNHSYEFGFDWFLKNIIFKNTLFLRDDYNLIDWVERNSKYYAENINRLRFYGIESEITFSLNQKIKLTLLNSYIGVKSYKDYVSKYGLNNVKNQTSLNLYFPILFDIDTSINISYKIREDRRYTLTSIYMSKNIIRNLSLYFRGKNIFNERYEEIKGVPQARREFSAGIKLILGQI